jgi:galactosamine-6-phosphate isomerase
MGVSIETSADHEAMSRQAAQSILAALANKPDLLLCAAGGSTPLRTYELLAEGQPLNSSAFRSLRVIKLDEWGGLGTEGPGSCEAQLRSLLVVPLNLQEGRYIGFRGESADPEAECQTVRRRLEAEGPIDVCVLGLGLNGHVGMNEPAPILRPTAHVAHLTETSLRHSMLANVRSKPTYGLTLGMAEILASRQILLLVSGAAKREPLRQLLRREITTGFPASLLWLHSNWVLLCDRDAADGLDLNP